MNSEELELSLRTEFESHLKNVVADMRQEFTRFKEQVEAEFDKHKTQLDAAFHEFSERLDNDRPLEAGFAETVVEHLRLARDEGARISATAFAEAEKLQEETAAAAPQSAGVNELSAAINDIAAQDSQATILKSLVHHAAQFTPRGAFFIIKNEHFVGWRVFGKEGDSDEQAVREVFLPVASSTVLGESVRSLSAVESSFGTYNDDSIYLNKLEFGQPSRMYAIPLIARGRGVAVLYADYGTQGEDVNFEALETLVRVAGLTVEVLAAAPAARVNQETSAIAVQEEEAVSQYEEAAPQYKETVSAEEGREEFVQPESESTEEFQPVTDEEPIEEVTASEDFSAQPVSISNADIVEEAEEEEEEDTSPFRNEQPSVDETDSWSQPTIAAQEEKVEETEEEETYQPVISDTDDATFEQSDYQFRETPVAEESQTETIETSPFETPSFSPIETPSFAPVEESSPNGKPTTFDFKPTVSEPAVSEPVPAPVAPVKSRFSERNVDLPIEVGEDERRLHNDARRFARLLVSEIKLYNEQKVKEGRESQDLYERLREAIDRSRDMYDKRVQPPVAAKFDYFHYELVSSLAEGEEGKLGGNYPGAAV